MSGSAPVLDLDKLKKEQNLSEAAIIASGFSLEELQEIYYDYYFNRFDELTNLKNEFLTKYIVPVSNKRIHSFNGRVKDPYHLIEKVIRKRSTNDEKYRLMTSSDYYKYITDLIGCRILLVYKTDWVEVHNYLISQFINDPSLYIKSDDYVASYEQGTSDPFMAEAPVAHMRLGDAEIYPSSILTKRDRYYRSLHYIIRYGQYYIEVQVRTLFEEAWGEVDHDALYPYFKDNDMLVGFSKLINRAAGMSDEMSSYLKDALVPMAVPKTGTPRDVPIQTSRHSIYSIPSTTASIHPSTPVSAHIGSTLPESSTAESTLDSILF